MSTGAAACHRPGLPEGADSAMPPACSRRMGGLHPQGPVPAPFWPWSRARCALLLAWGLMLGKGCAAEAFPGTPTSSAALWTGYGPHKDRQLPSGSWGWCLGKSRAPAWGTRPEEAGSPGGPSRKPLGRRFPRGQTLFLCPPSSSFGAAWGHSRASLLISIRPALWPGPAVASARQAASSSLCLCPGTLPSFLAWLRCSLQPALASGAPWLRSQGMTCCR